CSSEVVITLSSNRPSSQPISTCLLGRQAADPVEIAARPAVSEADQEHAKEKQDVEKRNPGEPSTFSDIVLGDANGLSITEPRGVLVAVGDHLADVVHRGRIDAVFGPLLCVFAVLERVFALDWVAGNSQGGTVL